MQEPVTRAETSHELRLSQIFIDALAVLVFFTSALTSIVLVLRMDDFLVAVRQYSLPINTDLETLNAKKAQERRPKPKERVQSRAAV
jgi:hypothetical protein